MSANTSNRISEISHAERSQWKLKKAIAIEKQNKAVPIKCDEKTIIFSNRPKEEVIAEYTKRKEARMDFKGTIKTKKYVGKRK